jgi:catechol 2,3-dioxygenase-like lactoylglutathione lyase family enzyme
MQRLSPARCPPLHHLGYVVEDLRTGVERFVRAMGAGPFFVMEHIPFDEVSFEGRPAAYDHSSAFGRWGPVLLELTQVHDVQPAGLRERLVSPGAGVGHVAWLVDSLEDETARLRELGVRPFHAGRSGPASAVWFDGRPLLGHPIEVLQRREELLRFYELVWAAAEGWDGSDPFRVMAGPPV